MKKPTKYISIPYQISKTTIGVIHLTSTEKYKVVLWPYKELGPGEKFHIEVKFDDSFEFDTHSQATEYLKENAEEEYKEQFS